MTTVRYPEGGRMNPGDAEYEAAKQSRKNPPIIMAGGLTNRVYIVTRYTDHGDGRFTAHDKYDVTEEFDLIASERFSDPNELELLRREDAQARRYET